MVGHYHLTEVNQGEEEGDGERSCSLIFWGFINQKSRWLVDLIRVPPESAKISSLIRFGFLLIGVVFALPFFYARFLQDISGDLTGENKMRIHWAVEFRLSGDLLIPISFMYLSVHFFSDLSRKKVQLYELIPMVVIALFYIIDVASFFEQPTEFMVKTNANEEKDDGGIPWFHRQIFATTTFIFALGLVYVQKRRCLSLADSAKRSHLFNKVALVGLSTWPTLVYLYCQYLGER